MKYNMGSKDRIIRSIIGVILVIVGLLIGFLNAWNWIPIVLFIVAGILIFTAIIGFCPLYLPMKISTADSEK
ncbi:MAG: YgaP family membrane protein [Promethearchaeota archaeon]